VALWQERKILMAVAANNVLVKKTYAHPVRGCGNPFEEQPSA
jgi:hypothetical protein